MRRLTFLFIITLALTSCQRLKDKSKEAIKESGNAVGQGASQFAAGVRNGVDRTFQSHVEVDSSLERSGFHTGKFSIQKADSFYILSVYGIFEKNIEREISVRVYDEKGQEYGRSHTHVMGHAGDASYLDFHFDPRTDIESRSRFVLQ
ncbi:MAG: hypothetical protein JST76_06995 [Bacteroidetes bacterium]|nr:hypothetical protein [Bacteroidota bacterium]